MGDNTLSWGYVNIQIPEISIGVLAKILSFKLEWVRLKKHINMALWCLVIHADYHLIDVFCFDVLSILHHALWPCQLGGDVLMHGYSK